jgi:hypothetical protein
MRVITSARALWRERSRHVSTESLNKVCGVFEFDVDETGNTHGEVWEWK